jgi:hypothetical protein
MSGAMREPFARKGLRQAAGALDLDGSK